MTSLRISLGIAALLASTAGAFAQETTGYGTLAFGRMTVEDADEHLDVTQLGGRATTTFGSGLSLDYDLGWREMSVEDLSFSTMSAQLGLSYAFAGGFSAGAYVEKTRLKVDLGGSDDSIDFTSYGLTGGYAFGSAYEVSVYYGKSDFDDIFGSSTDVDVTDYGVAFAAEPGGPWAAWASAKKTEVEETDESVTSVGLAGAYEVSNWTVFGGVTNIDVEDDNLKIYGIGGGYTFNTSVPMMLSLEFTRSKMDDFDADVDTVTLGLTFGLGKKGPMLPYGSLPDTIRNPRHSVISDVYGNFLFAL